MFNLIIFTFCILFMIYFLKSLSSTKQESFRNKKLFIEEFKKSELNNHNFTRNNYLSIKKWVESKYPLIEYIKKQDLLYSQCIFKEDKSSFKYKYALSGKHDIATLKQEIEFDTLRECFTQICKNDSNFRTNEFLSRNKRLIVLFTQNIIFTKKINNYLKLNIIILIITMFFLIRILISFF